MEKAKRFFATTIFFLIAYLCTAQSTVRSIRTNKAGTLCMSLPINKQTELKELHVFGPIDNRDIQLIKDISQRHNKLEILNLKNAINLEQIQDSAFAGCVSLEEISLPKPIKRIGKSAFELCTSLKSITIGENAEYIGDEAFYGCQNLKFIELPNGVKEIGNKTFCNCIKLSTILLPSSVKTLGSECFLGCKNMNIIRCLAVTPPYCQGNPFEGIATNECSLYVPNSTKETYKEAIVWNIFENIHELKKQKEQPTLAKSTDETTLTIFNRRAGTLKDQISVNWVLAKKLRVRGPINYEDLKFLRELANFNGGQNLEMLDLTATTGVSILPDSAFGDCKSLNTIALPDNITMIGDYAFGGCKKMSNIKLPKNVTKIGDCAFIDCQKLHSIFLPRSIENIGKSCFKNCSGLAEIDIPELVTSIEDEMFMNCDKLSRINMTNNVKTIGKSAFWACTSLDKLTLSQKIEKIESSAFGECSALTEIYLPKTLKEIEPKTFWGCTHLESIYIPDSTTIIKDWAFRDCNSLRDVTLGLNIETISDNAFGNCPNIFQLYCRAATPPLCTKNAFDERIYNSCIVTLPKSSYTSYVLSDVWWKFSNIKEK